MTMIKHTFDVLLSSITEASLNAKDNNSSIVCLKHCLPVLTGSVLTRA